MRHRFETMNNLQKEDGTVVTDSKEIEEEVLEFYKNLMGKVDTEREGVDIYVP